MFRDVLAEMVNATDGCLAGVLMGFDGIAVDHYLRTNATVDVDTVGMEFSVILKEIRKAANLLDAGNTREVAIQAEHLTTVIRLINEDYFVVITLNPTGNFGKARYLLRLNESKFLAEL